MHADGPFVAAVPGHEQQRSLRIITSEPKCVPTAFSYSLDAWASLGRWALRYWTLVVIWSIGILGLCTGSAWATWETGCEFSFIVRVERY